MCAGPLLGPDGAFVSSPLPIAPHKAGVVGDADQAAIAVVFRVAAEHRRPARGDGAHDPALGSAEVTGMRPAIGFTVAGEDIRKEEYRRKPHGFAN